MRSANGLIIAAPRSGSGKTLVTLGLIAALRRRGIAVAPAKTGPDYIDTAILARVAGTQAINLDPWAMKPDRLRGLATAHATGADLLLIEGVMGLFATHPPMPAVRMAECARRSASDTAPPATRATGGRSRAHPDVRTSAPGRVATRRG